MVLEMSASAGRRGTMPIVAWHEVFEKGVPGRKFRHSDHRNGAHACTISRRFSGWRVRHFASHGRTPSARNKVPYSGRPFRGGAVPGTSCQATVAPSLWDFRNKL